MRKYFPRIINRLLRFRHVTPETLQQWGEKSPDEAIFTKACLRIVETRQTDVSDTLLELTSSPNEYIRLLSNATWAYINDADRGRAKMYMLAPVFMQLMGSMKARDEIDVRLANKIVAENLKLSRAIDKDKQREVHVFDLLLFSGLVREYCRIISESDPFSRQTTTEIKKNVKAINDHPWIGELDKDLYIPLAMVEDLANL